MSDFTDISIFWTDFRKIFIYIIFHESPSSESRGFPCGQTDRMKLTGAFLSSAMAHEKWKEFVLVLFRGKNRSVSVSGIYSPARSTQISTRNTRAVSVGFVAELL